MLTRADIPDAVFPSDNAWGVPVLDMEYQADMIVAPFQVWGAKGRRNRRMTGTYHFYTDDWRFNALWTDPSNVVNSGCKAIVEPNFSCFLEMPPAVALWHVYRKRWLARYWQTFGIKVLVDMNVASVHYELNMLGVPKGWKAYATRAYTRYLGYLEYEHALACDHAETENILWVVYGGGKACRKLCIQHGWLWMPEDSDLARNKQLPPIQWDLFDKLEPPPRNDPVISHPVSES